MSANKTNMSDIGDSLLEHSRAADFTARGAIEELFPYIIQASKRMSTRAISQFLEEKHGVKISYVTIGKALRNPGKYWSRYYDAIEPHAWVVADVHNVSLKSFMSESEKFEELLKTEKVYPVTRGETQEEDDANKSRALAEYEEAVRILDEKWFCFDDGVLEDARFHLLKRFNERPQAKPEDEHMEGE